MLFLPPALFCTLGKGGGGGEGKFGSKRRFYSVLMFFLCVARIALFQSRQNREFCRPFDRVVLHFAARVPHRYPQIIDGIRCVAENIVNMLDHVRNLILNCCYVEQKQREKCVFCLKKTTGAQCRADVELDHQSNVSHSLLLSVV